MTSFAVNTVLGPGSALFSAEKGSLENRRDCVKDQTKNSFKTVLEAGTVAGAGTTGYIVANKKLFGASTVWNSKLNRALKDFGKKAATTVLDISNSIKANPERFETIPKWRQAVGKGLLKTTDFIGKVATKIGKSSTRQKVLAGIVAGTAVALTYVLAKGAYKSGQIDQKYTDKAQAE